MNTVYEYQLHAYLKGKYKLTEEQLFDLPEKNRKKIIDNIFNKFANHRLFRDGLTNTKNTKDRFDNYRSYSHIKSLRMLTEDITITKQKSKDKLARWKRKLHLAKKERFNARKRRKIREISDKEYKQKWEPKDKQTKARLERLRKLKQQEQNKEYER